MSFYEWLAEKKPKHLEAIRNGIIYEQTQWNEYIMGWLDDVES